MTPSEHDRIYLYSKTLVDSKPNYIRDVVPTIGIKDLKVISGSGSIEDPYIIEV